VSVGQAPRTRATDSDLEFRLDSRQVRSRT
jgi:hypothetical protein